MTRLGKALVAFFLANLAAVLLVFWSSLDAHAFASLAGILNAAGRITALVGTFLVLVQLVLRAHVSWLVTALGTDRLKAWHTTNAYAALGLLAAHGALQIVGYTLSDRVDLLSELGLLLTHYEGMVLAFASLALLGGLTLISLERYRHRIPWPTWRSLHLFSYVAVLASIPHQLATGSDFIDAPVAVVYWTALLAATLAILVAARVPPLWRAATATGAPHPAVVAVGTFVVAAYLVGTVRLSDDAATVDARSRRPNDTARPASSASASPAPSAVGSPTSAATLTIQGDAFETPYGFAQVRVTLIAGRITEIEALQMPAATKRSKTISNSAEYWLRKRAIEAQSATFEILSGATYTSEAYQASLASALRAAAVRRP